MVVSFGMDWHMHCHYMQIVQFFKLKVNLLQAAGKAWKYIISKSEQNCEYRLGIEKQKKLWNNYSVVNE